MPERAQDAQPSSTRLSERDATSRRSPAVARGEPPTTPNGNARRAGRWCEHGLVAAAVALTVWFYGFIVAVNGGFDDGGDHDYYQLLLRGWMKGQLHLDKAPSPELLALADPYDPAQNGPHRLGDVSYYKGKYYLYFGAAPALVPMLPYRLLTGREMTTGAAVFCFATLAFVTASALWLAIRRRYFPTSAAWIAPMGVLGIGFGTHLLALAQRPMNWELPIAAGAAFTLLATAAAYGAIHGSRPLGAMALAGLGLGLAVGSRPSCLLAAPLLLAPIAFAWRAQDPARSWWKMSLAAAVPLGACGLALMAHNTARFEHPFEFGQHYQLSGAYESKLVHFSVRFIPHNFAVYFFQPLKWTWEFPFVLAWGDTRDLPAGHFGTEEVCGIAVTLPFVWGLLALPLAWMRRAPEESRALTATLASLAGYAAPVTILLLSYFGTCARYQADFAVPLGVLAGCGLLALERAVPRGGWAGLVRGTVLVVSLVTVAVGALLAFDYHGRSLGRSAPERWLRWESTIHHGLSTIAGALGAIDGPRELKVRFQPRPSGTVETLWRPTDPRADERIVVEHAGDRLIRFGYARGAAPVVWGRLLEWKTNHTHTVRVQMPSLYGPPNRWVGGLRRPQEFRERSCAAVWFSGGRALGTIVPPLPRDIAPGGAIGTDFSGEVRRQRTRVFRADEIGPVELVPPDARRGGTLRLRVFFADRLHEEGEPLFAVGAHYRSSILFVRAAPGGGVKFVYENHGVGVVESDVVYPSPEGHTVEIELPAFHPERFGEEATGDVLVRADGVQVLHGRQVCFGFAAGSEAIGLNPFGTTCGPVFRGWLLAAEWQR